VSGAALQGGSFAEVFGGVFVAVVFGRVSVGWVAVGSPGAWLVVLRLELAGDRLGTVAHQGLAGDRAGGVVIRGRRVLLVARRLGLASRRLGRVARRGLAVVRAGGGPIAIQRTLWAEGWFETAGSGWLSLFGSRFRVGGAGGEDGGRTGRVSVDGPGSSADAGWP
jgi:hypothetical protein